MFSLFLGLDLINKLLRVLHSRRLGLNLQCHYISFLLIPKEQPHTAHRIVKVIKLIIQFLIMVGKIIIQLNLKRQPHGFQIVHPQTLGLELAILVQLQQAYHVSVFQDAIALC